VGLIATIVVMGLALSLFATALLVNRRPVTPGRPRMVPWTGLQMLSVVVAVFMFAHLISLLSGHPLLGRLGY